MSVLGLLKFGLLSFWALWFTLVVLTNLFDGLKSLGILPQRWLFASQNFSRVCDAVAEYRLSAPTAAALFAAVLVWQLSISLLLWRALALSWAAGALQLPSVNLAFTCAIGLWLAFLIAEEVFKRYRTEGKHLLFFLAQLLSLLAIHLLPG